MSYSLRAHERTIFSRLAGDVLGTGIRPSRQSVPSAALLHRECERSGLAQTSGGGSHGDRACPRWSRRTCPGAASTARGAAPASATDHCCRYPGNQQNRQQRTAPTEVAPFPPLAHQSAQPKKNQGQEHLTVSRTAAVWLMGFTNRRRCHVCRQGQGGGGRSSSARCYRCR
jgi:hypothetical protein